MVQDDLRRAVRQQLVTDRLLGVRSIPMAPLRRVVDAGPREPTAPTAGPSTRQAGPTRPTVVGRAPATATVPISSAHTRPGADALAAAERLRVLDETQVKGCRKCALSEKRTQTVFGQGHPAPRLVFVGEGPGYDEDKQGLAFVGAAGQLLTKMIAAMGLSRDEVYICNVVKCRPPGNRTPAADEILACSPYLREQLEILQPEVIVALGAPAAKTLLNTTESIGRLRGQWHEYFPSGIQGMGPAISCLPTYHPAYLLRTPSDKRKTWDDLQMVMARLGLPVPAARA